MSCIIRHLVNNISMFFTENLGLFNHNTYGKFYTFAQSPAFVI